VVTGRGLEQLFHNSNIKGETAVFVCIIFRASPVALRNLEGQHIYPVKKGKKGEKLISKTSKWKLYCTLANYVNTSCIPNKR
jgi:hypothetical protein